MEKIFFKFMVFLLSSLLCYWLQPAPGICADQNKNDASTVKKMEDTIKKQDEMIKQLQSEINKQRLSSGEASGRQQPQNKENLVEQALRERWGCCDAQSRVVNVTDGVVSVYFNNIHDIIFFFETGADAYARLDLEVFLKKAGLENGTIEYYSADKKLYSISGSLTKAETAQYY
jgi:hypothetical protein